MTESRCDRRGAEMESDQLRVETRVRESETRTRAERHGTRYII